MTPWPRPSLVYFMKPVGMDGPIKIGCSSVPENRLEALAVWSPFPLELLASCPGSYALEKNIHDCFIDAHSHHEWFRPVRALVAGIAALRAGAPVEVAFDLTARQGSLQKATRTRRPRPAHLTLGLSWERKLWWAEKRAKEVRGEPLWLPEDVWSLIHGIKEGEIYPPTAEQIARLEAVRSAPEAHMLTRAQRWPEFEKAAA